MKIVNKNIVISFDSKTGNLIQIEDESFGLPLLQPGKESEIRFNGKNLSPKLEHYDKSDDRFLRV